MSPGEVSVRPAKFPFARRSRSWVRGPRFSPSALRSSARTESRRRVATLSLIRWRYAALRPTVAMTQKRSTRRICLVRKMRCPTEPIQVVPAPSEVSAAPTGAASRPELLVSTDR